MKLKQLAALLIGGALLTACAPKGKISTVVYEDREVAPVEVVANKPNTFDRPLYNPSYTRRNDLLHTALDVRFDWQKQHLLGKATLKLKPLFYPTDSLRLDAKGFDLHKVVLKKADGQEVPLKYVYNDRKNVFIQLDRTYTNKEEYTVYIEYTAKPNELPIGGSDAITSDKGLYFINPLGEEQGKPRQIWTQGETESSSCWFPTIDRPNERCTQEIYITIEDNFKTLSNGLLISSNKNADGTRTDYWKMDLPHAPYLFMMAIGEFAVVKDNWEGMLLEYYVEPKFEKDAKNIFPYTGEMLSFFSKRFGVRYPWPKYSQVVVKDYVSGAMENTTAVIFGDFVQMDSRSLIDNSDMNEGIVAHEMMHHWFGDLVTCESWSHLPLNESFANYSEYLWLEHKHGKDAADYHRMNEIQGYINQAVIRGGAHPLIYYGYNDKEDMFDAHSYNKGGAVLHMLRNYLGDDAFFEALRVYLETHKYSAAEAHDLRLAFEKVCGEDLNWFFNQWFFTKGHPKIDIKRDYDAVSREVRLTINQLQDFKESTVFILPIKVDIYVEGSKEPIRHNIKVSKQDETFRLKVTGKPLWISVDADRMLLCERKESQSVDEWMNQYRLSKNFQDRYDALRELKYRQGAAPQVKAVFQAAIDDPSWVIRSMAIDEIKLDMAQDADIIQKIEKLSTTDPRPNVRSAAVEKLGSFKDKRYMPALQNIFAKEQSYAVLHSTLKAIERIDQKEAISMAKGLEKDANTTLRMAIAELYSNSGEAAFIPFFEENWKKTNNYSSIMFMEQYGKLLINSKDDKLVESKLAYLYEIGTNPKNDLWHRYAAASTMRRISKAYFEKPLYKKTLSSLSDLISKENDPTLKRLYAGWSLE